MLKKIFDGIMDIIFMILRILRLVIASLVGLLIVIGVYGIVTSSSSSEKIAGGIITIICSMIMYVIYLHGKENECPACKKKFSLKNTGEEIVKKDDIYMVVENKTKNRDGEVVGYQEQHIPGERVTYKINMICKNCGKTCCRIKKKDIPKL